MKSKTAIVTGAACGIGKGIAETFLRADFRVIMLDINAEALAKTADEFCALKLGNLCAKTFDVADENAWKNISEIISSDNLCALINNAGIGITKDIRELSLAQWNKVISTNLTSIFLAAKYCADFLKAANGAIVNIASTRAEMSEANTEAYSASKGGIVALTHALAISLAPVRVNCISPGWIDNGSFEPFREVDLAQHPVGRIGTPYDIANLAKFLADNSLAGFITGQNFFCDGGMTKKMIYEQ